MFCMALFAKFYIMAQVSPLGKVGLLHESTTWGLSYENGYSPRPNLSHNRVARLVCCATLTRHEKGNKFPSHTWLPYLTPNGVTA